MDTLTTQSVPKISAMTSVLNTPELLKNILLALPAEEILITATKVCKAFNTMIRSSLTIQKHIVASSTFMQFTIAHPLEDPGVLHLDLFWGDVFIKQHKETEIIYAVDKADSTGLGSHFLDAHEVEKIPLLSSQDCARFGKGWIAALQDWLKGRHFRARDSFYPRFELALYMYLDPVHGNMARKAIQGEGRHGTQGTAFDTDINLQLRTLWEKRTKEDKAEWEKMVLNVAEMGFLKGWIHEAKKSSEESGQEGLPAMLQMVESMVIW